MQMGHRKSLSISDTLTLLRPFMAIVEHPLLSPSNTWLILWDWGLSCCTSKSKIAQAPLSSGWCWCCCCSRSGRTKSGSGGGGGGKRQSIWGSGFGGGGGGGGGGGKSSCHVLLVVVGVLGEMTTDSTSESSELSELVGTKHSWYHLVVWLWPRFSGMVLQGIRSTIVKAFSHFPYAMFVFGGSFNFWSSQNLSSLFALVTKQSSL